MSGEKAVLLLGRRDEPTDGVEDYCRMLQEAAARRGLSFEIARVGWAEKGWRAALGELRRQAAAEWRGRWVLLQFTTLAWSRRGFPLRAPHVLRELRQCGARPGIVFHDFAPLPGKGLIGGAREFSQSRAFRQLYALSELAVFTVPVNKISWLPLRREKAVFIPVGSNFPEVDSPTLPDACFPPGAPTVAVFGITGGDTGRREVSDIAYALKAVCSQGILPRLAAIGRGSEVFEKELRQALKGSGIEISVPGLMPSADLARTLARSSVLLCVRGHVSSRRGSAIAGIACGLPIVGYRGDETGFPVVEAGVLLVNQDDQVGLASALVNVLTEEKLRNELRCRSKAAARDYFSWDVIASQFAAGMASPNKETARSPS